MNDEQNRERTPKSAVLKEASVEVTLGLLMECVATSLPGGVLDLQVPGTPRFDPVRPPWYANGTRRGIVAS